MKLALSILLLLVACEGETEEEVPPEEDGRITCGATERLDGLTTGDTITVSVNPGSSLVFDVNVTGDGHGLRLRAEANSEWRRVTEVWTPEGDRRVIPATAGAGESLLLEVIVPADQTMAGSVTLACADVPEVCFDLSDNDGNGNVDCADLNCARDEDRSWPASPPSRF